MNKKVFSDEQLTDIYNKYSDGLNMTDIGKSYNVSLNVIRRLFVENGWESKGHGRRRYSLNERYFDNIDSPNKAYIFGLLLADGCN